MRHCLILGGGLSGRAAERLAVSLGFSVSVLSDSPELDAACAVASADLILTSPGVKPLSSPLWQAAFLRAARGDCEFFSELEFAFRHWPGRLIAITGTNGKTTTTELTSALLSAAGIDARPSGNIGCPLSNFASDLREGKLSPNVLPVVEVSSFQLELCDTFAPYAAALLNITSDHIDRYAGGFDEYAAVKKRIFNRVPPENRVYGLSMKSPVPRRVTLRGESLLVDGEFLIDLRDTALSAPHNRENLASAIELCLRILPLETVFSSDFRSAIRAFHPGRHRLELVLETAGVRFVNDSKATNPASTVAALRSTPGTIVLLLGGLDKGMDFSPIAPFADRIRFAVLYGECRSKIASALPPSIPLADCGMDFALAVKTACEHAKIGDTVLLSPACASMDLFHDYKERGDRFAEYVKKESALL